jgi:hypothetical protein
MLNFCSIVANLLSDSFQSGRHNTAQIQHCPISSKFDMWADNDVPTMLNLCGIVTAILKMATARNVLMSGINSGHHNLPKYEMSLKSDNVEFVRHCGSDRSPLEEQFCVFKIFKMAAKTRHTGIKYGW